MDDHDAIGIHLYVEDDLVEEVIDSALLGASSAGTLSSASCVGGCWGTLATLSSYNS